MSPILFAAIQGTLGFCLVWLVCTGFKRLPPNWRCWLWRLVSVKFLVAIGIAIPLTLSVARIDSSTSTGAATSLRQADLKIPASIGASRVLPAHAPEAPNPLPQLLAVIWLAGVAAVLGKDLIAWVRVNRVLRSSEDLGIDTAQSGIQAILDRSKVPRPLRCRTHPDLSAPALVGIFKKTIVLPSGYWKAEPGAVACAFAHEIAHYKRRDIEWILLAELTKAIFWFHPFAWIACREQRAEAEIASDQLARIWCEKSPKEYGQHLLTWVDLARPIRAHAVPGLLFSTHELTRRMKAMSFHRYNRRSTLAVTAVLALPLVLAFTPIRLMQQDAKSNSTATEKPANTSTAHVSDSGTNLKNVSLDNLEASSHILGDPKARVTIVEFADFTCPACIGTHKKLIKFLDRNKGKVSLVYHHFPLYHIQGHELAKYIAAKSEMLNAEDFWNFAADVYGQSNKPTRADIDRIYASFHGERVRSEKDAMAKVESDLKTTMDYKINAAPTCILFIDRKPITATTPKGLHDALTRPEFAKIFDASNS